MVKGKINNELIGLYYDCSKSLKENLSTFKELNLKVGKVNYMNGVKKTTFQPI